MSILSSHIEIAETIAELARILELAAPQPATRAGIRLREKQRNRPYYYDLVGVKRWVLGDGGRSGNCDTCVENADLGWIDQDATFEDSEGAPIDEAPAHPRCTCTTEFDEKRRRVYV